MKVKKFKNLWTMGLIIFGVMLVALYVAKLVVPELVIGVAQIDAVVQFGNYVDTHKWAHYLFNSVLSLFGLYFYCCACCRVKRLNSKELLIIIASILLYCIIEEFLPSFLFVYNNVLYILLPFLFVLLRKETNINVMYSTSVCFTITSIAQVLSLYIRDISTLITYPNTATLFILLIDGYIWNLLLYFYFNNKRRD